MAGTQELTLQIDIDQPLPLLIGRFSHRARRLDSGVVDQDVQTAVQMGRGAKEPGRILVARDVAANGQRVDPIPRESAGGDRS